MNTLKGKTLYEIISSELNIYSPLEEIEKAYVRRIYSITKKIEFESKKYNKELQIKTIQTLNEIKEIDDAFNILKNPEKRENYDNQLRSQIEEKLQEEIFNRETVLKIFSYIFESQNKIESVLNSNPDSKLTDTKDQILKKEKELRRKIKIQHKEFENFLESLHIEKIPFIKDNLLNDSMFTVEGKGGFVNSNGSRNELEELEYGYNHKKVLVEQVEPGYIFYRTKVFKKAQVKAEIVAKTIIEIERELATREGYYHIQDEELIKTDSRPIINNKSEYDEPIINHFGRSQEQTQPTQQSVQQTQLEQVQMAQQQMQQQMLQQQILQQQMVQQIQQQMFAQQSEQVQMAQPQPMQQPVQQEQVQPQPVQPSQPVEPQMVQPQEQVQMVQPQPVQQEQVQPQPVQPPQPVVLNDDEEESDDQEFKMDFASRWNSRINRNKETGELDKTHIIENSDELTLDEKKIEAANRLKNIKSKLSSLQGKEINSPEDLKKTLLLVRELRKSAEN